MISKIFSIGVPRSIELLKSDGNIGLDDKEVQTRIALYGKNQIPEKGPRKKRFILADQFVDPIIYILLVAFLLALFLGDWAE
ncbi:MAG: cation-transporting P-type ATPase, partial [Eudoraea sp.]